MRINVTEPEQCGCVTCVQHRTLCTFNTNETEPSNVIGSSFTSVPFSSGPVQAIGDCSTLGSTSTSSPVQSSSPGTETPLDPPVTTSVDSEPAQPIDSTNVNWGVLKSKDAPANASASSNSSVSSESAQALGPTTSGSLPVPVFGSPPFAAPGPSLFCLSQTPVTNISGSASRPSIFGPMQAPVQASAPNTCPPFSFLPQQDSGKTACAYPSPFSHRGDFARTNVGISPAVSTPTPTRSFGETHFCSPFGPRQDFPKTGVCFPRINQENTLNSSLPGFGVNYLPRYPSNLFGPNQQTKQGSRYPRYSPTLVGQDKYISISASNSHGHKSHEELRWEDYKNGDKGERPNPIFPSSPSLFASPSIPDHLQRSTTTCPPFSYYTFPPAVQRPHDARKHDGFDFKPAAITSPTSGCTACGATSSSSSSDYLGFNVATNPPSAATSLPGFYCPLMFGTPNFAALGTTTPAVQAYPMIPNLAAQGTTSPAVQLYPLILGTPYLAAQGTSTPAVQPYPVMFGSPNLAAQGTTPAVQAYLGGVLPFANMNLQ